MTIRTAQGTCRAFHARAGEYRLAAGEVAPAVMAKADQRMQGDPLTPAEEQALLRQGFTWVTRNRSWLLRTREFR